MNVLDGRKRDASAALGAAEQSGAVFLVGCMQLFGID